MKHRRGRRLLPPSFAALEERLQKGLVIFPIIGTAIYLIARPSEAESSYSS